MEPPLSMFVGWEEVYLSNEKGKREVNYYLKRRDGNLDLAVVGKERSLRHMSYYYAIRNRSLLQSLASYSSLLKLRSRREVVEWLSSIVSDSPSYESSQMVDGSLENKDAGDSDISSIKDHHTRKLNCYSKEFMWLGSPWSCRKRRRHYQSFCNNGVKIAVCDFVYVLAEEGMPLVAHLEDMYEDSKGNKMVVVRWFHKIDEVGIVLRHDFNDREIFFSICLQDLNIECIDGLATVLSLQHYEKFLKEATHTLLEPFMCHRLVDNDDVKPFDISQVQGYWKQEILRYMYSTPLSRPFVKPDAVGDDMGLEADEGDNIFRTRPKKRHRGSKVGELYQQLNNPKEVRVVYDVDIQKFNTGLVVSSNGAEMSNPKEIGLAASLSRKETVKRRPHQHLVVGSHVEVLSQDSGIRGCWFRAIVLKSHKDKVKVQYQDIQDAEDEAHSLEEWVLASSIAVSDKLGLRICGRTTLRPHSSSNRGRVSCYFDVGTLVDAWWCDGWWEGIVINKESEDIIQVYFPGECRISIFGHGDLRHSQEWMGNRWKCMKGRPDIVKSILSGLENKENGGKVSGGSDHPIQLGTYINREVANNIHVDTFQLGVHKAECSKSSICSESQDRVKGVKVFADLAKDYQLSQLKWKSTRKRVFGKERKSLDSKQKCLTSSSSSPEDTFSPAYERMLIPESMKVDRENCKYKEDYSLFNSSIPLGNLVMSR